MYKQLDYIRVHDLDAVCNSSTDMLVSGMFNIEDILEEIGSDKIVEIMGIAELQEAIDLATP